MHFSKVAGVVLTMPIALVSASCGYGTILHPRATNGTVEIKNFGYVGEKGPTNWVALDPTANALCSTGTSQSPIDIVKGSLGIIPAAQLKINIPDLPNGATFENLGTTVEVVAKNAGTMSFNGTTFALQQFHFHLPSEHLSDGASMAMEMHMVWQGPKGEVAVVGVFVDIDTGAAAAAPEATIPKRSVTSRFRGRRAAAVEIETGKATETPLPKVGNVFFHVNEPKDGTKSPSTLLETVFASAGEISKPGTATKTKPLVMSELVNNIAAGSLHTYQGSLTTPPCSEGVRWLVSNRVLSIKPETFIKARSVIGFNSRFPQNKPGEKNVLALSSAE